MCSFSANLDWCPAWLAYTGAVGFWLLLIGAGVWSVAEGEYLIGVGKEFRDEATEETCLLIDIETHTCDCGSGCKLWNHEYVAISSKCPNQTLSNGGFLEDPCDYEWISPLTLNRTYKCWVLPCDAAEFSFERELTMDYDPLELIIGGLVLLTCFGVFPLLCAICYFGYKCFKQIPQIAHPYKRVRQWTGKDN